MGDQASWPCEERMCALLQAVWPPRLSRNHGAIPYAIAASCLDTSLRLSAPGDGGNSRRSRPKVPLQGTVCLAGQGNAGLPLQGSSLFPLPLLDNCYSSNTVLYLWYGTSRVRTQRWRSLLPQVPPRVLPEIP